RTQAKMAVAVRRSPGKATAIVFVVRSKRNRQRRRRIEPYEQHRVCVGRRARPHSLEESGSKETVRRARNRIWIVRLANDGAKRFNAESEQCRIRRFETDCRKRFGWICQLPLRMARARSKRGNVSGGSSLPGSDQRKRILRESRTNGHIVIVRCNESVQWNRITLHVLLHNVEGARQHGDRASRL